jgi:hypothetical protein
LLNVRRSRWRANAVRGVRDIAAMLGRSPSTISRELDRNAATRTGRMVYRASVAQWKAELRSRRPKAAKLVTNPQLRAYVQDRLAGAVHAEDGTIIDGPGTPDFKGRNKPRRQDRRWVTRLRTFALVSHVDAQAGEDGALGFGDVGREGLAGAVDGDGRRAQRPELLDDVGDGESAAFLDAVRHG